MNSQRTLEGALKAVAVAFSLVYSSGLWGQYDPDPSIFDGAQNGASSQGGAIERRSPLNESPLGGSITVVNESSLPPLDAGIPTISVNGPQLQLPGSGSNRPSISSSSSSSGSMGIPMGGGGSGSEGQQQNSPFPMPRSSSSSSSSQSQQQLGQMPQQSGQQGSQSSSSQQGQSGKMPQGQSGQQQDGLQAELDQQKAQMKQAGQSGSNSPLSGSMPPPPPEQSVGDPGAQIGAKGELATGEESSEGEAAAGGSESQSQQAKGKKKSNGGTQSQTEGNKESDGQEMPDDMGGSQGVARGKGTVEDTPVPSNL